MSYSPKGGEVLAVAFGVGLTTLVAWVVLDLCHDPRSSFPKPRRWIYFFAPLVVLASVVAWWLL